MESWMPWASLMVMMLLGFTVSQSAGSDLSMDAGEVFSGLRVKWSGEDF
jgi:hypothetical protein